VLTLSWGVAGLVAQRGVAYVLDDDLLCEHEVGGSNYGETSWSWWPLGPACTWTQEANRVTDHEDPSWAYTVLTVCCVASGVVVAQAYRRGWVPPEGAGGYCLS